MGNKAAIATEQVFCVNSCGAEVSFFAATAHKECFQNIQLGGIEMNGVVQNCCAGMECSSAFYNCADTHQTA